MDRPLKICIRPSRLAVYYSLLIVSLSLFAIAITELPLSLHCLLFVAVIFVGWRAIQGLKMPLWSEIEQRDGGWFIYSVRDQKPFSIGRKVFIGLGIISIQMVLDSGKHIYLLLWSDSADEDSLRRLRIALFSLEKL